MRAEEAFDSIRQNRDSCELFASARRMHCSIENAAVSVTPSDQVILF